VSATDLVATAPLAAGLLSVLVFKRGAVVGSLVGLATVAVLAVAIPAYRVAPAEVGRAAGEAAVLSLHAVAVIVPGLYLTAVLRARGNLDGIVSWVEQLAIPPTRKAVVLMVGFVPAVESLTGFGVSLFLSVPVFLRLFARREAVRLSLLGMNIMPWGTLALATVVGASLVGEDPRDLAVLTALTSALTFPYLALLTVGLVGGRSALRRDGPFALLLGLLLPCLLLAAGRLARPEIAGVAAGVLTGLVGAALGIRSAAAAGVAPAARSAVTRPGATRPVATGRALRVFLPYVSVLAIILATRQIPPLEDALGRVLVVSAGDARFAPLLSPGLALALVSVALTQAYSGRPRLRQVLARARNACLSVAAFLLLSRLMLATGMIAALAGGLLAVTDNPAALVPAVPALGIVAALATGSNVGANALLLPLQHRIGAPSGHELLFSAGHNSAAGHAVFASIPIIVLVLAIMASETPSEDQATEHELLRFALPVLAGVYLAVLVPLAVLALLGVPAGLVR
jgi:lactate permease